MNRLARGPAPTRAEAFPGVPPAQRAGVILVGRGSLYSRKPESELKQLATDLALACPDQTVVTAVLEQGKSSLPKALQKSSESGVEHTVIVPAFMPVERATQNWLRFAARRWLMTSGSNMRVSMTPPLSQHTLIADALANLVVTALDQDRPIAPTTPRTGSVEPDWSVIPPHASHVLFCQGPRCTAAGAGELGTYFRKRLKEQGLDWGENHVLCARTGCLYPCNLGPTMVVYPDGVWYCGLDEAAIDRIIDEHLIGGRTVGELALSPSPEPQAPPRSTQPFA